ncbi:MAG: TerB family tellurite resistance protein [Bacteroidia bacterium]
MNPENQLLKDYSDLEKGAYLGAIASIATADRTATTEETNFLEVLSASAQLSQEQMQAVLSAAQDPSNISLQKCLDQLKNSELRFSLITDIISFAKSDGKYTPDEEKKIKEMATYLNINAEQYSALSQFVTAASQVQAQGEDISTSNFLDNSAIGDTLKRSGIPTKGLMQGLLGLLAPILISKVLSGRNNNSGMSGMGSNPMGGLGGILGGILNGQSHPQTTPQTQSPAQQSGGLDSLIHILSGNKSYGGMGNILGNILNGKRSF